MKNIEVISDLRCGSIHLETALKLRETEDSTFRVLKMIETLEEDLNHAKIILNEELKSDKSLELRKLNE